MKVKNTNGYSKELASMYVSDDTEVVLLSTKLMIQYKWRDNKPTDEIASYKVLCGMPDDYFYVKFDKKIKLPAFLSNIKFKNLEACEVNNNVWFRAEDIEEA